MTPLEPFQGEGTGSEPTGPEVTTVGRPNSRIHLLMVEDNPLDAHVIRAIVAAGDGSIDVEAVGDVRTALARLTASQFHAILLDLALPDAHGLEALQLVRTQAPEIPVVVLTGRDDQSVAIEAVRYGAQDYLTKERLEGDVLLRALRYAIERHRLLAAIQDLSIKDQLTGLYNRRGFFTLAEQQLNLAARKAHRLALLYADIDGLKQINDRLGHRGGDCAIHETAELLRDVFRLSDVCARMAGDEFVVLAVDVGLDADVVIRQRMRERLATRNAAPDRGFVLSLSVGVTLYHPPAPATVDQLLAYADAAMYAQKRTDKPAMRLPSTPESLVASK
jgi:two-component system cell cycle response regulator